ASADVCSVAKTTIDLSSRYGRFCDRPPGRGPVKGYRVCIEGWIERSTLAPRFLMPSRNLVTVETSILRIRRQNVVLDFHLAALYRVETKSLNQAVRRNLER